MVDWNSAEGARRGHDLRREQAEAQGEQTAGSCRGETCYRVAGHFGGMWDQTEWMSSLAEAEQAYDRIKQGNWMQLSIERTDGKIKAAPDSDEWYQGTES